MVHIFPLLCLSWSNTSCLIACPSIHPSTHLDIHPDIRTPTHPCIHPLSSSYHIPSVCQDLGCVGVPWTSQTPPLTGSQCFPDSLSPPPRGALLLLWVPTAFGDFSFRTWCCVLFGVLSTGLCVFFLSRGKLGSAQLCIFLLQDPWGWPGLWPHPLSLPFTQSFSSRAKVAAADGPPGIPAQTLTTVKHTVKIEKDAVLQDYGFHISESLPLTVVAVTAGRG